MLTEDTISAKGVMVKKDEIHDWLLKSIRLTGKSLADTQLGEAWARLGFASAGLLYIWLHAGSSSQYGHVLLASSAAYFLYTGLTIFTIQRHPPSAFYTIAAPIFDILVVSCAMLVDGGQSSAIYLIYLIIIFSNAFRYGKAMMLYTQILSLIGLLAMTAFTSMIDLPLLLWQATTLLLLPAYVYLIRQRVAKSINTGNETERSSFHLFDKLPVPVFIFDRDATGSPCILYTNSAADDLFGHEHAILIGKPVDTLTLPEDRAEMIRFCLDVLLMDAPSEQSTASQVYIRGRDSAGTVLKLTCIATRMQWQNRWIGTSCILDITLRETLQQQLISAHKQGYMSTLVGGIVHDFRNVLNNMMGYAELLHMDAADAESRQQLEEIIAAGDRGSDLITHLLKLSKKQDAKIPGGKTSGEMLARPLENMIGLSRLQTPPHIQLVFDIEKSLPDVAISVIEIELMLLSLINNAVQAMASAGKIHIRISNDHQHRLATADQGALSIRVSDNGHGIAEENLDNILKPFWTSRSDTGGFGLGLAMVQRIIKRHHGSISIDSVANQQTTFSLHIPPLCTEAAPAKVTPTGGHNVTCQPAITPCHVVLLVDDIPDILKIHEAMLSRMGHCVDTAENGLQALALFKKQAKAYDLIITDYRMPGMDGLELIEHIRALDSNISIMVITAYGEDGSLQRACRHGATLLTKPVTMEKLTDGIAAAMRTNA